jgi:glycosyltransferase involved in cell wall biosynthesis
LPEISVIIPAHNAAGTLSRTLEALAAQEGAPEFEVVVVDDGSNDGTAELAERAAVVGRVVRQAGAGPARARNAGAAAATGRVLAFTDADCYPTRRWLAEIVSALDGAELVQGAVLPEPGVEIGPFDRTIWVTRPHGLFETANLTVRRELFDRLGGFESWLVPRDGKELGEDVWFGWRATRAGARIRFAAEALVHHAVFPGGPGDLLAARRRLRYFPAMAARIPELRSAFLWRRVFLSPQTAAFDAALVGVLAAVATRRPAAAALAAPYAVSTARALRGHPPLFKVKLALARVAADAVGGWSLAAGSVAYRAPVL